MGQRHVRGIPPLRDQNPSNAQHVVARIEHPPAPVKPYLHPGCEVARRIGRCHADVAQIAGAIPRGNVHTAAKGDRQMRVIATDALRIVIGLCGAAGGVRSKVIETDMVVNEIADRLNAR